MLNWFQWFGQTFLGFEYALVLIDKKSDHRRWKVKRILSLPSGERVFSKIWTQSGLSHSIYNPEYQSFEPLISYDFKWITPSDHWWVKESDYE